MNRLFRQLLPFITIGIIIVTFALGLIVLFYVFLIGTIIGAVLFLISWIRTKFFSPKLPVKQTKSGRIIDSDDWKKL